ncbi:hypothetical protein KPH14_010514 [Odynerus spinipes]|uniref:UDP-glycosyltransferase n=1 Tax=Odynerus spinipes TaxID=1348599 RepID=A0AAD9RU31_9HYME|nr:hypothetical protein KPH14_010514 [Odynerus spinipes]
MLVAMSRMLLILILTSIATQSSGLSVLFIEALLSSSHHIWISSLVKELLRRGHHVHFTSIHTLKVEESLAANYTHKSFDDLMQQLQNSNDYEPAEWANYNTLYTMYFTHQFSNFVCEKVTALKAMKETLELVRTKKFDVIVQDVTLVQCLYGLWEVAKGNPSVIGYVPFGNSPWIKDYIGGSSYPAIRPYVHLYMAKPVSLWDRTLNFIYFTLDDLLRHYYMMPINQKIANEFFGKELRPLAELEKNISVLFVNTHYSFEPSIPLPSNAIEIAGIHAQAAEPVRDERIRKFLDGAKHGVIVISLGTNVAWKAVGLDKIQVIVSVLAKLKQRVLWKLDKEVDMELPDNILALKWIPQNDVLTHKNVKAVWTHVGLLSTHEAIWHGIPVIGMPFFMDQRSNIKMLVEKGVAVHLDFKQISVATVEHALLEIIYDPKYMRNMKKLSREFRDRPMPPLDLAAWYVEFVSRHPGRDFGSPGRFLTRTEENLYDVYALLFAILLIPILICSLLLKSKYIRSKLPFESFTFTFFVKNEKKKRS